MRTCQTETRLQLHDSAFLPHSSCCRRYSASVLDCCYISPVGYDVRPNQGIVACQPCAGMSLLVRAAPNHVLVKQGDFLSQPIQRQIKDNRSTTLDPSIRNSNAPRYTKNTFGTLKRYRICHSTVRACQYLDTHEQAKRRHCINRPYVREGNLAASHGTSRGRSSRRRARIRARSPPTLLCYHVRLCANTRA